MVEASSVVDGQFRLAGMQPRRGQSLELVDWYDRQFDRLGVTLRLNTLTIVTPDPFVGKELSRASTDGMVRLRLGAFGCGCWPGTGWFAGMATGCRRLGYRLMRSMKGRKVGIAI